jgi:hypothetical protein
VALHRQLHADVLKKRVRQLVDALPVLGAHGLAFGPAEYRQGFVDRLGDAACAAAAQRVHRLRL